MSILPAQDDIQNQAGVWVKSYQKLLLPMLFPSGFPPFIPVVFCSPLFQP
jgi:hypothetical protein